MKQHFFISGLPRTGSTLLCNILAQNPELYLTPATSGCHDTLFGVRNSWDKLVEHKAEGISYSRLKRVMNAHLNAYHDTDKEIIIDKGRGWLSLIEMIEFVKDEKAKIIVPVRNIAEILSSFEKLWRKTTGNQQWGFEASDYFKSQTVEGRCDIWSSATQPVGLAYNRVCDALSRGLEDRMLFVEFDLLTLNPSNEMNKVYDFLGINRFNHDFDNVPQYTKEDDINIHHIEGLHDVRPKVEPIPHSAYKILGQNLINKYSNLEIWRK
jgi:sulfotransferase